MRDELLDIDGVGPATADKIEAIVTENGSADVADDLEAAVDYLDAGRPGYAEKYVRRAYEQVAE